MGASYNKVMFVVIFEFGEKKCLVYFNTVENNNWSDSTESSMREPCSTIF